MLKVGEARWFETVTGRGALPATCGELFQGLIDDQPCLISCPIDWLATAHVTLQADASGWHSAQPLSKTLAALALASEGFALGGQVEIASPIPMGRGYGSSTADIGAALYALARAAGRELGPPEAAQLAAQVEPTDSTLFPGLTLFAHRDGCLLEDLGPAPGLAVLVLDPGGEVDTLAYNREMPSERLRRFTGAHREAFGLIQNGLAARDWEAVGRGATLSATTHQAVLFNPLLEAALDLSRTLGGLGVCRAHSGTILGLLIDPARVEPATALQGARAALPPGVTMRLHQLVDGGAR